MGRGGGGEVCGRRISKSGEIGMEELVYIELILSIKKAGELFRKEISIQLGSGQESSHILKRTLEG